MVRVKGFSCLWHYDIIGLQNDSFHTSLFKLGYLLSGATILYQLFWASCSSQRSLPDKAKYDVWMCVSFKYCSGLSHVFTSKDNRVEKKKKRVVPMATTYTLLGDVHEDGTSRRSEINQFESAGFFTKPCFQANQIVTEALLPRNQATKDKM